MVPSTSIHASAFAYHGAGCLLIGASGCGKSTLLAQALIHGGELIADDQVLLSAQGGVLYAKAPDTIAGVIALHGLGLIRHSFIASHPLHFVVSLEAAGQLTDPLPEPKQHVYCGVALPCAQLGHASSVDIASLLLYLKAVHEQRTLATDWRP